MQPSLRRVQGLDRRWLGHSRQPPTARLRHGGHHVAGPKCRGDRLRLPRPGDPERAPARRSGRSLGRDHVRLSRVVAHRIPHEPRSPLLGRVPESAPWRDRHVLPRRRRRRRRGRVRHADDHRRPRFEPRKRDPTGGDRGHTGPCRPARGPWHHGLPGSRRLQPDPRRPGTRRPERSEQGEPQCPRSQRSEPVGSCRAPIESRASHSGRDERHRGTGSGRQLAASIASTDRGTRPPDFTPADPRPQSQHRGSRSPSGASNS